MLAAEGYDPAYGARPLKRLIQKKLQNPLAMRLLEGAIRPGETVRVGLDSVTRELAFAPARAEQTAVSGNAAGE
jgi:ATP-dependent Clp protease ATP-binding subunit ClpB